MAIMSSARRTEPITVAELDLAPSYPGAKVELIRGVIVISPPNEGYTKQHLDGLPDDGRRHELVDGLLLVTPAPTPEHQVLVVGVLRALLADCPTGLRVVVAPLDVELTAHDVVQPDVVVAPNDAFGPKSLTSPPLLAVEVLSPSTRTMDLLGKREAYESAGVASYWIVDPEGPRLTVWDLVDGSYVQVADVAGDDEWTASSPYAVTIAPGRLLG